MTKETSTIETAFQKAQTRFEAAKLDKANTHFRSKYATLKSVQEAVYPALSEVGISVHFGVCWHPETLQPYAMKCMLRKGEGSIETMVPCNFTGTPQQQMSAMTYAKRASLAAVTGVILDDDSDDDGNAANNVKRAVEAAKREKPTVKQTLKAIAEANDDRLLKIVDWIEANADTSKKALLEAVDKRRDEIAKADSFKSWDDDG